MNAEFSQNRINFHTHTYRCNHAQGSVRDMCLAAIEQGVTTLGFSEHVPFESVEKNTLYRRISHEDLKIYRQEIRDAQKEFPQLQILAGLELEFEEEYFTGYYPELRDRLELDYMIGGVHYIYRENGDMLPFWVETADVGLKEYRLFMEGNIRFMESGLLLYLAHPDAFSKFYPALTKEMEAVTRDVFACAADLHIPLELNANGWRKKDIICPDGSSRKAYPWLPFWELATEYDVQCVVGSDAHAPADVWGNTSDLVDFAEKLGLPLVNQALAAEFPASASGEKSGSK